MPIVNPIHVRAGEVVDIHWHRPNGVLIERREMPLEDPAEHKSAEACGCDPGANYKCEAHR